MNYQKLHDRLVAIGRQRGTKEQPGFELHHVIPSCMGGNDNESNKALLTFHEHFVVHRLLTKIHPHHSGLHCAVWRMTNNGKLKKSGRVYEKARQDFIDNHPQKTPKARAVLGGRMTQLAVDGLHPAQLAASAGTNTFQNSEFIAKETQRKNRLVAEGKYHTQTSEFKESLASETYRYQLRAS